MSSVPPLLSAIVGYAEAVKAGVVVVGTHGRSGLARLTFGSTAAGVLESAPCSGAGRADRQALTSILPVAGVQGVDVPRSCP